MSDSLNSASAASTFDVLIIGAGISGLRTADLLTEKGYTVGIIEAKDRVGGRTHSITVPHGDKERRIDLGGQWIAPKQTKMLKLLDELGIGLVKQFEDGKKVFDQGVGAVRTYKGMIPPMSLMALLQLQYKGISKLDKMAKTIPPEDPMKCPHAREWDSMTLQSWVDKNLGKQGAKDAIRVAVAMVLGCEPSQVSVLSFTWYVAVAGSVQQLCETGECAQDSFIKGGAMTVSEKLAERTLARSPASKLVLSSPVTLIRYESSNNSRVTVETTQGTYCGKYAVMAVPPSQIGKIAFEPEITGVRRILDARSQMGCYAKCIILYKTPFWRSKGYCGEGVRLHPSEDMPVVAFWDACYENGDMPAIAAFVPGNDAIGFGTKTEEERKTVVLQSLERCLGPEALDYIAYYDKVWTNEPYTGGCPVNVYQVGVFSHFAKVLRQPCGPIHFAGTETSTIWCGYMEGAVTAAERAVMEVSDRLEGKPPLSALKYGGFVP